MPELFERIQDFFRENPRMWIVAGVAGLVALAGLWFAFGGFSAGPSQFQAAAPGPEIVLNNAGPYNLFNHGDTISVSWSKTDAVKCYSMNGFLDTGERTQGNANSSVIDACGASSGQISISCTYTDGTVGQTDANFFINTLTCPTSGTPTPPPSGDCTLTNGLWYCKSLTCGLAGNGSNPPVGPATSMDVIQYRTVCDDVEVPNNPQVGCKVFFDATPKSGGQEGYPPKDPYWTCTGSAQPTEREGRYCYTPFIKPIAPGPVECCAGTGLSGDCVSFNVISRIGGTPTPSGIPTGTPAAAVLKVTCSANSANLTWNIAARSNSNTIQRLVPGGSWTNIFTDASLTKISFSDTPLIAGAQWRQKSGANVASNVVSCSGVVSTPTPSVSGTPIVQGPPVQCSPNTQSVGLNQTASLQATGGNDVYIWNVTQGGTIEEGGNQYIGVQYRTTGRKTLRVSSGGTSAMCSVDVTSSVVSATPLPSTPILASGLSVRKTVQNSTTGDPIERSSVTAFPGQTVQFMIRISNSGTASLTNVSALDVIPEGMSFVTDSTTIDGQPVFGEEIITSGLSIGTIAPGTSVVIEWSALADQTSFIAPGPNQSSPLVRVNATDSADAIGQVSLTLYGEGSTGPIAQRPGDVQTGPGGAVLASLLAAAVLTLLYSGYTRSPAFRRKEAKDVSKDQGPMDFRS